MPSVTVTYSGVHQAYQIALAAEGAGCLDRFLCSFFHAPAMWGGLLGLLCGSQVVANRRLDGIPRAKIKEHPWPELRFKLRQKLWGSPGNSWINAAIAFDTWAARQIKTLDTRVVVCSENCARETFRAARAIGSRRIYDCPGCDAERLRQTTEHAARLCGLSTLPPADTPEITRRKRQEIALADLVLAYSRFHAMGLAARGVPLERIKIVPLWTNAEFWTPLQTRERRTGPLNIIFAGGIKLRKGVPFLVEAVRRLAPHARLTLVGSLDPGIKPILAGTEGFATLIAPLSKERLRDLYRAHDLLVLPSLGDSFGFVALEAMACGLPVIVTTHCGVPVPDEAWRVPVMDAGAIAGRIQLYMDNREELAADGVRARDFATRFTPHRYRAAIGELLRGEFG